MHEPLQPALFSIVTFFKGNMTVVFFYTRD